MTLFRLIFRIGDEFFDTTDNRYGLEKDLIFINGQKDSEIIEIETIGEEESDFPTLILNNAQLSKINNAQPIESMSNDEYIKLAKESNKKIKSKPNYMNELLKKYGRNK